ncbi:Gfo/Idh/MocA family protein [Streptomyces sp. NPDC087212]|uniref:Gfo/Idh/MocA family protein n=1 Tax=Streptomyces sp. NPDC087212 TaxID=3365766 RepID=UPI00380A20DA
MMNWGFLGAGSIAESSLAPAVRATPDAALHSVASRDQERAAALGPEKTYATYRDLLADPDVDIVYIALHNSAHREWVEESLRAGKHVVCEKPLTLSAADVDALTDRAEASGKILVEAAWNRWHPRTLDMEDLLGRGALGKVTHVSAYFDGPTPAPGNYRLDPALGGGALYDVGYYAVSAVLAAFGWQRPVVREARQERWSAESADRMTSFVLDFPCGGTAEVFSGLTGDWIETFTVTGDDGELQLLDRAFTAGAEASRLTGTSKSTPFTHSYAPIDPYQLMVEAVTAAARTQDTYLVPLAQSRAIAQVIDEVRARV